MWTQRTPRGWRDRAPRLITLPNGGDAVVIEETFAGVPEDEKSAMLAGKAVEFFHLEKSA
jgi:hypothetical protein